MIWRRERGFQSGCTRQASLLPKVDGAWRLEASSSLDINTAHYKFVDFAATAKTLRKRQLTKIGISSTSDAR